MTHTKRLTAYEAPQLRCMLVPVAIKQGPRSNRYNVWNSRVHRWHRRAGK
jgi:hypothetical protein